MMENSGDKLVLDTPVGCIDIRVSSLGVSRICFRDHNHLDEFHDLDPESAPRWKRTVHEWFDAYFSGRDLVFSPLLRPAGTGFQQEVWHELRTIPPGQTRTYGQVATAIGREEAARAVGQACGRNPVPILVPCHRVVPAGPGIGKYSGPNGVKRQLLEHESKTVHKEVDR